MKKSLPTSYLLILAVLVVGILAGVFIVKSAPKPEKRKQEITVPLVQVTQIEAKQQRPSWSAGATADAKTKVTLVAQVSGQINTLDGQAIPGAFLKKGSVLAKIDDSTYR